MTRLLDPAELLFERPLRSRLSFVKPSLNSKVENKQLQQKATHDNHAKYKHFSVGEEVLVKRHRQDVWTAGTIVEKTGPLSLQVETAGGHHIRCHADQIRKKRYSDARDSREDVEAVVPENVEAPEAGVLEGREVPPTLPNAGSSFENPESRRRYPARERHPPDRLSS